MLKTKGWIKVTYLVYLSISLAGCTPSNEHSAADYLERIQNVLDVRAPHQLSSITPDYPAPRELTIDVKVYELSIREFLSLRECALHQVIANRNSLLGKVALSSQRLFNDLEILRTGPDCVHRLTETNKPALAQKLKLFLESKRRVLGHSLWRAVLGASENAEFWRVGTKIADYPDTLNHESVTNISALLTFANSVKHGHYGFSKHETSELERHLGQLRYGDGGRLLREYAQLDKSLDQANRVIRRRLKRPLCFNGKPTANSHHFDNVVRTFFIAKVQKHAVLLNRRYEQLMPEYLKLESALAEYAPPSYLAWAEKRQALMLSGREATKIHANHIQRLFKQCGLTPGTPTS